MLTLTVANLVVSSAAFATAQQEFNQRYYGYTGVVAFRRKLIGRHNRKTYPALLYVSF